MPTNMTAAKHYPIILAVVFMFFGTIASAEQNKECTDIARDDVPLLVFSTLGGGLTAVDPITSEIRWSIDDEPAIKVPVPSESSVPPYFPDPRDGSLYQLGDMGGLKKLPYTIPQLVASAPCRSSDGILYSGKKKDTWFLIDPKTGHREKVVGFGADSKESIGWATSRAVYLGRTQYTVLMYDSMAKDKNTKPWNVTFFDYSAHTMAPEVSSEYGKFDVVDRTHEQTIDQDPILFWNIEWLHLSGSETGMTVTLDRNKGTFLWQKDLSSPVVAVFLLGPDGLLSVPFTTVSDGTLKGIVEYARDGQQNDIKLFQSLYVGEHTHGLYALPALVDKSTKTISADPPVKLIDGPRTLNENNPNLVYLNTLLESSSNEHKNVVVLGHYQMPKVNEEMQLSITPPKHLQQQRQPQEKAVANEEHHLMATASSRSNDDYKILNINKAQNLKNNVIQPPPSSARRTIFSGARDTLFINIGSKSPQEIFSKIYRQSQTWLDERESKILKLLLIILSGSIVAMFWYLKHTVRELRQQSQSGSQTLNIGGKGSYQELIELGDGIVQVGKISFDPSKVLGKGCEGTFVFKGTFEKRNVAVKRLLPECFTLADREVALLRESDAHENVVRYFCTEQDRQFRYIAVELCSATLQDFTEGKLDISIRESISVMEILKQATNGLMHLHSLNIVHRDIKPQNVLLSLPNAHNAIRAMISDFGLCKKLNFGKTSFSRRSGVTGTEGWIAPEMLKGQRTTTSVDIFSLGCVFYYVISKGSHPFGDLVKRQLNILSYEFELKIFNQTERDSTLVLTEELITDMISKDPARRPPATAVLMHPFFWNSEKILNFLQDVSDRVEKLDYQIEPLKTLEKNSRYITRDDWNLHLDPSITSDLRKYRAYQGNSVRDLLRALRNKKHHYHELSFEMQTKLGVLPDGFTSYWIDRFPHLLSHSYHALQKYSNEHSFLAYYAKEFIFTKPQYFYEITEDFVPSEPSKYPRDSPKKYVKDYRYKQNESGISVAAGGTINKQFSKAFGTGDNNNSNYTKPNKKGSYNFHRNSNNMAGGDIGPSTSTIPNDPIMDSDGFIRVRSKNTNHNNNAVFKKPLENIRWTMPNRDDN